MPLMEETDIVLAGCHGVSDILRCYHETKIHGHEIPVVDLETRLDCSVYVVTLLAPVYTNSRHTDPIFFHHIRLGSVRSLAPEPRSLTQPRILKMRFTSLVLAIAASVTAQFPVAEEVLWPTNDWTVREAYSSVNDTKAEVGFSVTMYLPLNNTLEALHQTCGRSWDRKIIPTVPSDWATCEIDEKVAWRFQPGTEHDFPKTFTLQVLFWDRME